MPALPAPALPEPGARPNVRLMKISGTPLLPVALSVALLAIATTAVSYSPTLYRIFCEATGYGGTVTVSKALRPDAGSAIGPEITVRFDSNISPDLDWDFQPGQRQVKTHIGVPTTIFYHAVNNSDETLVGRATYNVTPAQAGYYFNKTDCFCFTEQKLSNRIRTKTRWPPRRRSARKAQSGRRCSQAPRRPNFPTMFRTRAKGAIAVG